ncbi:MAG: BspA family leucine-rich repeat surface protein [Lactobacillus sp.]|nr:BspA family leucine-rich repeat surface protein [Lactobacillus sp.]
MRFKTNPKYRLRKLSVGLCSVTLMAIFASHTSVVHADEVQEPTTVQEEKSSEDTSSQDAESVEVAENEAPVENVVDGKEASEEPEQDGQEKSIVPKVKRQLTVLASTTETSPSAEDMIKKLAFTTQEIKQIINNYNNADEAKKAVMLQSANNLKGFNVISRSGNTYRIGSYDVKKGGKDIVLPTTGDFQNLGLTCDKVTISREHLYNAVHIDGVTSLKVSDAGGTIACSDNTLANVFSSYGQFPGSTNFYKYTTLTSVDLRNFDTSNITDMTNLFSMSRNLKSVNMSGLDTKSVKSMKKLFFYCTSLTDYDLTGIDTSQVTDMSEIFSSCSAMTTINLSNLNTSSVTNMSNMFAGMNSLESIDLSGLDTSKVTNMSGLFSGSKKLQTIDLSKIDTSSVTDMSRIFESCTGLKTIDFSKNNTFSLTDMSSMFNYCSNLQSVNFTNIDTKKVTNMSNMFNGCSSLKNIDLSSFDTSNVTNMSSMFTNCRGLTTLDVSNFDTRNVKNMQFMFTNLMLRSFDVSSFDTSNVENMSRIFAGMQNVKTITFDTDKFKTDNAVYLEGLFLNCFNLESVDVSKFNTSKAAHVENMFERCYQLKKLDVSNFDFSNVKGMDSMFYNALQIVTLDLRKILSTVPDAASMSKALEIYGDDEFGPVRGSNVILLVNDVEKDKAKTDKMNYVANKPGYRINGGPIQRVDISGLVTKDDFDTNYGGSARQYVKTNLLKAAGPGYTYTEPAIMNFRTVLDLQEVEDFTLVDPMQVVQGTELTADQLVKEAGGYSNFKISNYDKDTPGKQTVTVTGTDASGNEKSKTVDVTVFKTFTIKPSVSTYKGVAIDVNSVVTDPGDYTDFKLSGYSSDTPGSYQGEVSAIGPDGKEVKKQVSIDVLLRPYKLVPELTVPFGTKLTGSDFVKEFGDYDKSDFELGENYNPYQAGTQMVTIKVTTKLGTSSNVSLETVKVIVGDPVKDATFNVQWVVPTPDGKVIVGDKDDDVTITNGYKTEDGTNFVLDSEKVKEQFTSGLAIPTEFAQGNKLDPVTVADGVVGDGDAILYKYDVELIKKFNEAKEFVTSHYQTDEVPANLTSLIQKDGTVTVTDHGITLAGKFAWKKMAEDTNVTVKDKFTFEDGKLPGAATLVVDLPTDASAVWTKEPTAEDPAGVITVTFKDGSKKDYSTVGYAYKKGAALTRTEADMYELNVKDKYTVEIGNDLSEKDLVNNFSTFPTTAKWTIEGFDKNKVGEQKVTISVELGDGSKLSGETVVMVTEKAVEPTKPEDVKPTEETNPEEVKPVEVAKKEAKSETKPEKASPKKTNVKKKVETSKQLPQTGESIFGLLGILMTSLGLVGASKKREN